jgi:hypothetical protein
MTSALARWHNTPDWADVSADDRDNANEFSYRFDKVVLE